MLALHMVLVVNLMGYTLTAAGHPRRSLAVDAVRTGLLVLGSLALIPPLAFMGAAYARLVSSYAGGPVVARLLRGEVLEFLGTVYMRHAGLLLACAALSLWTDVLAVRLAIVAIFVVFGAPRATAEIAAKPPMLAVPFRATSTSRKRICIIAFKDVRSTIHVLRQIYYLSPHFDLTVIGHGSPDPTWPMLTWHAIPEATRISKLARVLWYAAGWRIPSLYVAWYWRTARFRRAYAYALASGADAVHANDWQSLPIAIEVARRTGAQVVFHQHEFAELEREDSRVWRLLVSPALRHILARYTADAEVRIDTSITVCRPIAERYQRELNIDPLVVYNAPTPVDLLDRSRPTKAASIRLIHHGYAQRSRGIERMIEALALADRRFTLDLMLMGDDAGYVRSLRRLAAQLAPGRVFFRDAVRPQDIVRTVAEYDIGLCVIQPRTYNTLMMLPNKLFEYVQAGLAVCVGPSPAMVDVVQHHKVGVCSPGFEPEAVAATLNQLTVHNIQVMRGAARRASLTLNADVEMKKVVDVYHDLFAASDVRVA
jgi:glycosyltransferase involved in cell wall biosynthesis